MKDKLLEKIKLMKESLLSIAKKYEIDVRVEEREVLEKSIVLRRIQETNIDRLNQLAEEITDLETRIVDKIKLYQIRTNIVDLKKLLTDEKYITEKKEEYVSTVKNYLNIYNSTKLPSTSVPNSIVNEIFDTVYQAIKAENSAGSNEILETILQNEQNTVKINSSIMKEIEKIERETKNSSILKEIKNIITDNEQNKKGPYFVNEKIISLLVKYAKSEEVKKNAIEKTKKNKNTLETKINERMTLRNQEKETEKKKEDIKTRLILYTRKFKTRIAALILSLAILPSVSAAINNITNTVLEETKKEPTEQVSDINPKSLVLTTAGILGFSALPIVGVLNNGKHIMKNKKARNKAKNEYAEEENKTDEICKELNEQAKIMNKSKIELEETLKELYTLIENNDLTEEQSLLIKEAEEVLAENDKLRQIEEQENMGMVFITPTKHSFLSKKLKLSK